MHPDYPAKLMRCCHRECIQQQSMTRSDNRVTRLQHTNKLVCEYIRNTIELKSEHYDRKRASILVKFEGAGDKVSQFVLGTSVDFLC